MFQIHGRLIFVALALVLAASAAARAQDEEVQGVYEYVVEEVSSSFEEAALAVEEALVASGYQLLSTTESGTPEGCDFRAVVFSCWDPTFANQLFTFNDVTAPYAIVDRINLFQDERGLHVSIVNPRSIYRTVLMEDEKYMEAARAHYQSLRSLIAAALSGKVGERQYGQLRSKGYIDKTMRVVAGGPFADKIETVIEADAADPLEAAHRVQAGWTEPGRTWGMRLAYVLELPERNMVLLGTTGEPMEGKSFDIVKAGADESRKDFACPGLAHAGAYPLELVVRTDGEKVVVQTVDVMYRMKVYFEDAGNWAFMKNRGMPGSIEKEIRSQLKAALKD